MIKYNIIPQLMHSLLLSCRFPSFSLHGIQKTSPMSTCSEIEKLDIGSSILNDDKSDKDQINAFFDYYKDDDPQDKDCILACGMERLCDDLNVCPTDFAVLALAWKFNARTMCKFTRLVLLKIKEIRKQLTKNEKIKNFVLI